MVKYTDEMMDFYRDCADRLDEIRRALPSETRIDNKFADFLETAIREIREEVVGVAPTMKHVH